MLRRRSSKRTLSRSREIRCNIGQASSCVYFAGGGMTYVGPNYPEYSKRLNEDTCQILYKAARASRYATSQCSYMDVLGREEIVSTTGNRGRMNNCTHRKIGAVNLPYMVMYKSHKNSSYYYCDYFRRSDNSGYALYLADNVGALHAKYTVGSDPSFSSRAFWSMRPKFQGQVSLINSLFELKDFKDVLHIGRILSKMRSSISSNLMSSYKREFNRMSRDERVSAKLYERGIANYTDVTPDVVGGLARDASGTAAAGVLAMNLAVKPTIADFLAIAAQLATSVQEKQKTFLEYGNDGSLSHFGENELIKDYQLGTGADYAYAWGRHYKIKRVATMRSYYSYKLRSQNEALSRYWGLSGTVEALWNMLPLSFVIDYIFTVGKALEYMERDDHVTNLTTDYCESLKIEASAGLSIVQSSAVHALIIDGKYYPRSSSEKPHLISGTQCTRYSRKVMEPYKGPALPKFKLPSSQQAVNVLALARCFVN